MPELMIIKNDDQNKIFIIQHNTTLTLPDMTNIILTFLLILVLFLPIICRAKTTDNDEAFFGRDYTNIRKGVFSIFVTFLISSAISGLLYLQYKHVWFTGEYLLKIVLGISILIFCFLSTIKINLTNPFSKMLGNISYETYLIHGFIADILILSYPQFNSGQRALYPGCHYPYSTSEFLDSQIR